ncbi:PLP-dependent cysteine synthase family protein [Thalassospira lucentensis]|jgi:cysteine synthase A|uniref:L-cysteine desulfhydrase Cds1 n=1 Tax=Thalassospira lucentensis TaxID=168935 RepID=A0A358HNF8_9PROT|nr:PLP-dependent cysteine synthase family protein [Thalassospira lucentensis]HBU96713.1 cysteine synthase [Thalassospira lucentensis]HCW68544.1 cysteine synthase [Thalassospira lucentensis]
MPYDCQWVAEAISTIEADFNRSADTHLIRLDLPPLDGIGLYLKDESTHPSGSLKHRLARSLFLYGLCNGWITKNTPVIEASSGSTAVSEAYFARLLGLRFIAVMPKSTSQQKIDQIAFYGGESHLVDQSGQIYEESQRLARELGGHYMDQFTYAERATDWRGNNNIAESIFEQLKHEPHPVPRWVIVGAGTGGTSSTIGRYIRYGRILGQGCELCVADPENSVFYNGYETGDCSITGDKGSRVEGIGRPRVEPSFNPNVVDRMYRIPDAASFAALQYLEKHLGRRCGGSTGTNLIATLSLISDMNKAGEKGSVVTLLCDGGDRYRDTYYNPDWIKAQGIDLKPWHDALDRFDQTGIFDMPLENCARHPSL